MLSDKLRAWFGDVGGHISALDFAYGSSHSKIREAVRRAVSKIIILVSRIFKGFIKVPG